MLRARGPGGPGAFTAWTRRNSLATRGNLQQIGGSEPWCYAAGPIQTSHRNSLRILLEREAAAQGFALHIVIEAEALAVIKPRARAP